MTGVAVPRPRSRPAPDASVQRPTMHALFVHAGGDTDAYDVDAYMGLLREHGYAAARVGLVEIVSQVMVVEAARDGGMAWDKAELAAAAERFAHTLTDELGKHGWRIHDVTRCVRPKDDPLTFGRPMTPEEEARLVIPSARPRRRRTPERSTR